MTNELLINLVNNVLGEEGKRTAKGNVSYHCPNCKHSKRKLEINFDEQSSHYQSFSCWVCDFKSKKLVTLFKKVNTDNVNLHTLSKYTKSPIKLNTTETVVSLLVLPQEYKTLSKPQSGLLYKKVINYLKKRNIQLEDIIRYNIGYCEQGDYKNMIIIPSYDEEGKLNYFTARSIYDDDFRKYKNPDVSRDIIPFELYINWDSPIIICEGVFDAIAIRRNAIPLLGKNISKTLQKKLALSSVKKIFIALDNDAKDKALNYCEHLTNQGKKVYFVDLKGKDPSEIGFNNFIKLLYNAQPLSYYNLMEQKLSII
jgi:hypothetical protein